MPEQETLISKVQGNDNRIDEDGDRWVKVLAKGDGDLNIVYQVAPYGDDSPPIDKTTAIMTTTGMKGEDVVIGYINLKATAKPGEKYLYSTDLQGVKKTYTYYRGDGTLELNGNADNAVRYSKLEKAYNELNDKFNKLINAFNTHTHASVTSLGTPTPPTAVPTVIPAQPSTGDITAAKIDTIKTP